MADKIVEAREPFTADVAGVPINVSKGDRFYADDPVLRGREHLFGDLTVRRSRPEPRPAQTSETATAAPGERRSRTRPVADGKG